MPDEDKLNTPRAGALYRRLEHERSQVQYALRHLRNAVREIKSDSGRVIAHPLGTLQTQLSSTRLISRYPWAAIAALSAVGFIAGRRLRKRGRAASAPAEARLAADRSDFPSASHSDQRRGLYNLIEAEMRRTAAMFLSGMFSAARTQLRGYMNKIASGMGSREAAPRQGHLDFERFDGKARHSNGAVHAGEE